VASRNVGCFLRLEEMPPTSDRLLPCKTKWHFQKTENGKKEFIQDTKFPPFLNKLKGNNEEFREVDKISFPRIDQKDSKLKVRQCREIRICFKHKKTKTVSLLSLFCFHLD